MTAQSKLLGLLDYIEQIERLKSKPAFSVPSEFFVAYQHEINALPEVDVYLQIEEDDVWLRIPRLQEINPPAVDPTLVPWIKVSRSPEKSPELLAEATIDGQKVRETNTSGIREQFDWYVEFLWTPWAEAEIPRRKTIAQYRALFALQQTIASEGAETPLELAWGIGYAAWRNPEYSAGTVQYPMLIQSCEVTLDASTFALEVRPREKDPTLEVDCFTEMGLTAGVQALEAHWKGHQQTAASQVNPFEASTFESVLRAAVSHLDPTGKYDARTDDFRLPAPTDKLVVTNSWVIFGRRRTADIFIEDIRRLKAKVEEMTDFPAVLKGLVEPGDDTVRMQPEQRFRGLSSSEPSGEALELYFPMPYNDEQVSIVEKLHANEGVVVQGPPGTGKTHTIANVICHFLAQGKRVLVASKGESALAVLQEKLPEAIRPLSVALLSDERDGMRQFENAVGAIASRVSSLNPHSSREEIARLETRLNDLHGKVARVDQLLSQHATSHLRSCVFAGRQMYPEELARLVTEQAAAHEWFDDEPAMEAAALPFTDASVAELRQARRAVGGDLGYLGRTVPKVDNLPAWTELSALHRDIVRERSIEQGADSTGLIPLRDSTIETFRAAQSLLEFLTERAAVSARIDGSGASWVDRFGTRLRDIQTSDPLYGSLSAVCGDIWKLEKDRREFVAKAIQIPDGAEANPDVLEAVGRLVEGKSAFPLFFGKAAARNVIKEITITGAQPATREGWDHVKAALSWRTEVRSTVAKWNALASEFGFPHAEAGVPEAQMRTCHTNVSIIDDLRRLTHDFDAHLHERIKAAFGDKAVSDLWEGGERYLSEVRASAQTHVERSALGYAIQQVEKLIQSLHSHSGPVVDQLGHFLTHRIGNPEARDSDLMSEWDGIKSEVSRVAALEAPLSTIISVAGLIEQAGAPRWAGRLRELPATADIDALCPTNWIEAWHWRRAVMFLDSIDEHLRLRDLFEQRRRLTKDLAHVYSNLVAERTWLGVFNNSPDVVRQALQKYTAALHAMGSGRGRRAIRYRADARHHMKTAYQAVPCWILPQWRVSETIPAEIGLFDLVVVDEASQSDIWALPALMRAKKLLVVGDHKQVSPSAVGVEEARILDLRRRFLAGQPHGTEMTPEKSIYDLATAVFAGNSVMLKEHFRCVPAIIEFSKREFYDDLKPLRIPTAAERLDPPLVDVFVKGGFRKAEVNKPEAKAIVDEIEAILDNPQMDGRSIGVVTLQGNEQAAHIHELISRRIDPAQVVNRRIAVGPPPVFQGRERDVMLVSMVLGPDDNAIPTRTDTEQRFNVALSRARDRMYLFRSADGSRYNPRSLNAKLIRHFQQPFQTDAVHVGALRERCESDFEREMFDQLVIWGYRIEPQVKCGGFRIDIVVEGAEGKRLAIECDGDKYHGPGQWQTDMRRQRVLERAGWTFWRCFASTFVRRRKDVLDDLRATLDKLGIEPLGSTTESTSAFVDHREVDPYRQDETEGEAA